jgi:hypothetical protein
MSELEMSKAYERKQKIIARERRERAREALQGRISGLSFIETFREMKKINSDLLLTEGRRQRMTTIHLSLKLVHLLDTMTAYFQYANRSELMREIIRSGCYKNLESIGVTPEELREIWE